MSLNLAAGTQLPDDIEADDSDERLAVVVLVLVLVEVATGSEGATLQVVLVMPLSVPVVLRAAPLTGLECQCEL